MAIIIFPKQSELRQKIRLQKIPFGHLIVLLLFFVLACYITFPLIFKLTSLTTGYSDELFIAYVHSWNIHSLFNFPGILNIFNASVFFPYKNTLVYSETFITNSLLMAIPVIVLKEPIVANNLTIILSLTFLGFFTYLLSFYLTKDSLTSFVAGLLVEFCPVLLTQFVHIQILASYLIPLSIIFLLEFLKHKKTMFCVLFLLVFLLQIWNSILPAYFIFFSAIIITICYLLTSKNYQQLFIRKNILLVLLAFMLCLPVVIPYFAVSRQFNYVRDIRETIHFALQPEDFLTTIPEDRFQPLISKIPVNLNLSQNAEIKPGFIGLPFLVLLIISLIYFAKKNLKKDFAIWGILTSACLGLLLSLGPFLHWQRLTIHHPFPIPLPYALFYYLVPGFQGIRDSSRWEMLFVLSSAVFVGFVLHAFFKKNSAWKYFVCWLLSAVIILQFNFPVHFLPMPSIAKSPKIYSWLNTTPAKTSLIEMPIYNWNMQPYVAVEVWREYYSTLNFRPMVNGTSGFTPPPWQDMVINLMADFPSEASLRQLKNLRVNLIIVHKTEYDKLNSNKYVIKNKRIPSGADVINFLNTDAKVTLIKTIDNDFVYKIK